MTTLIDSSAWVDFFRGDKKVVATVDAFLAVRSAAVTGIVYAEVLSGAPTRQIFEQLRSRFGALDWLEPPRDLWDRVAEARFALARSGIQSAISDLVVAVTCSAAGVPLLTRDRDFTRISTVVPLDLDVI